MAADVDDVYTERGQHNKGRRTDHGRVVVVLWQKVFHDGDEAPKGHAFVEKKQKNSSYHVHPLTIAVGEMGGERSEKNMVKHKHNRAPSSSSPYPTLS